MKTDKRSEMQFEELLRQAMQEDHANELERIPSEEELEGKVVFSKRHQRRMQRLFNGDSAVLEGSARGTLGTRRLIKILIASALLIGAVVLGMMVYSYYNPVSAFFPIMEDLKSISGGAPIRDGSLELSFTENIKVFSSIEELENELHTGAMYPRAGEDEALSAVQVRYAEFPDKKVSLISLENGCTVSVYLKLPAYLTENLPAENFQNIAVWSCCVLDVKGGVQATMTQDGIVYVIVAPDLDTLERIVSSLQ